MKSQKILPMKPGAFFINGPISFHNLTFKATPGLLKKLFGQPEVDYNDGTDKVNYEWELRLEDSTPFYIYDWKEYRALSDDEIIEWHVGHREEDLDKIKTAIEAHIKPE